MSKDKTTEPAAGHDSSQILVIDDEEAIRILMKRILSSMGHTVDCAADGREGLQKLLQTDYDLVIVDLQMQSINGIAFIQEAKKIWPWLSIIILTGFDSEEVREEAAKLGVRKVLRKPCKPDNLKKAIKTELERTRSSTDFNALSPRRQMKSQLGILRQISESALAADNIFDAILNLSSGLARLLPSAAVGFLYVTDNQPLLFLDTEEKVSRHFLDAIREEIIRGFEAVSGRTISTDSLDIRISNPLRVKDDGADRPESLVSIPVMIQDDICGMFVLAAIEPSAYSREDVSFLYHAANHLSMVMLALTHMRQLATHDVLTGLYNRAHLEEELAKTWNHARENKQDLTVVVIDVDYFKNVNDVYGHLVGDQVLKELSDLVRKNARQTDIVGRYGGDELVMALPDENPDSARVLASRLLSLVYRHVFSKNRHNIRLTVSMGIAGGETTRNANATELLSDADQALYQAKRSGRNRICLFSEPGDPEVMVPVFEKPPDRSAENADVQMPKGRILIADDEPCISELLRSYIPARNEVVNVSTFHDALDKVKDDDFDLLMLDIHFPDGNGLDLLPTISSMEDPPIVVVITGDRSVEYAITSLRQGAYDFIIKPFRHEQIVACVDRAMEVRRLRMEEKYYHKHLEELVREKSATLSQALDDIQNSYEFSMEVLASLIDAREHATGKHSVRVRELALILGKEHRLPKAGLDVLAKAGLLHDIGKVAIPDSILLKKGALNGQEMDVMRTHPVIGREMLQSNPYLQDAAEIVYAHHEKFDGSGYPRGLKGEQICVGARVFAVIDSYDAMRTSRVYSPSVPRDEAIAEIQRCSGNHFDPEVVKSFMRCVDEIEKAGTRFWNN